MSWATGSSAAASHLPELHSWQAQTHLFSVASTFEAFHLPLGVFFHSTLNNTEATCKRSLLQPGPSPCLSLQHGAGVKLGYRKGRSAWRSHKEGRKRGKKGQESANRRLNPQDGSTWYSALSQKHELVEQFLSTPEAPVMVP